MGITDFRRIYTSKDLASGESHHLRRHRRHRRRADEGGPVLRRRRAHALARHAEQAGAHPFHRHHPRPGRARARPVLSAARRIVLSWRRNVFAVATASFIGFTGFTLVMPFLPLYLQQLGVSDVGEVAMWSGLSLGVTPAITALLAPFWGRAGGPLRPQDHGRALARQLRRRDGGDGVRHAARGTSSRCAPCRGCSPATARMALTMAAESAPRGPDGVCDRHRADGAASRPGARPGDRRRGRADGRPAATRSS